MGMEESFAEKDEERGHITSWREAGTIAAISERGWREVFLPSVPWVCYLACSGFFPHDVNRSCLFCFTSTHSNFLVKIKVVGDFKPRVRRCETDSTTDGRYPESALTIWQELAKLLLTGLDSHLVQAEGGGQVHLAWVPQAEAPVAWGLRGAAPPTASQLGICLRAAPNLRLPPCLWLCSGTTQSI